MMPVIRVDDEVYRWLQSQAVPFEDNPNSVLRRLAGLDRKTRGKEVSAPGGGGGSSSGSSGRRAPLAMGRELIRRWKIPVREARFHRDGEWYQHLTQFPAAFCDCKGYALFESEEELAQYSNIHRGKEVHVAGGISALPCYRAVDDPLTNV